MLVSNCSIVDFKLFAAAVKCPFPINLEMMKLFLYLKISSVVSLQDLFMGRVWKPNCTAHRRLTQWVNRIITGIVRRIYSGILFCRISWKCCCPVVWVVLLCSRDGCLVAEGCPLH